MSTNRDTREDRRRTRQVMSGGPRVDPSDPERNWLGHIKGAARIDEMLIGGATRAQLETARGAVSEHLRHLRVAHDLPVIERDGVVLFDRYALEAGTDLPARGAIGPQATAAPTLDDRPPARRLPPRPAGDPGGRPASQHSEPSQTSADRHAKLHTVKLVLEIIAVVVTIAGGLVALRWR